MMKVGEVKMKRKVNVIEDLDGKKTVFIHDILFKGKRAMKWDEVEKYLRQYVGDICTIDDTTTFDEKTAGQYYKVTKGAGNYDNVDKIEQNEKECWAFKEKSDKFVRGIPQGLPQSYFLGNIYMIWKHIHLGENILQQIFCQICQMIIRIY